MKKNATPPNKTDSCKICLFFLLFELKFLCDLGELCGKNSFNFLFDKLNRDFYRAGHSKCFYTTVYLSQDNKSA